MADIALLHALRLKGRGPATALASALGRSESDVAGALDVLVTGGHAEPTKMGWKLTEPGREALAHLMDTERAGIDQAALKALYGDFCTENDEFKEIVTRWQLKSDTEINDHSDAAYDAHVLGRLDALHERFLPIVERAAMLLPRLSTYNSRFVDAIEKVRTGQHEFVARPLIDSYHTVWFELHEELIEAAGLTRANEAAAGRAQ
jgi:pyruvate,orthophosphate dikinase